jgi:hypothetical protein
LAAPNIPLKELNWGAIRKSRQMGPTMRTLVTALVIAMVAITANAQDASSLGGGMGGKGGKGRKPQQDTTQQKADKDKQKAADEAYKAALKRIPDPKQKYDPWAITH